MRWTTRKFIVYAALLCAACFAVFNKVWGPSSKTNSTVKMIRGSKLMADTSQARPLTRFLLEPRNVELENSLKFRWTSIAMVKSAFGNKKRRDVIRETWGSASVIDGVRIRTVFILGTPPDANDQQALDKEHANFGDILQIDGVDSYELIPIKTLSGMQWVSKTLPSSYFYSSADDDIALHVPNFIRYIDGVVKNQPVLSRQGEGKKFWENIPIMCLYNYNARDPPARTTDSKWYTSEELYPPPFWPPYCRGGWYTMSVALASRLHEISRWMRFLHLDDVWITGLMRVKLMILRQLNDETILNGLIIPGTLASKSDAELRHNMLEKDFSKVLVSHVWGNVVEKTVNVPEELLKTWEKWSANFLEKL